MEFTSLVVSTKKTVVFSNVHVEFSDVETSMSFVVI